MRYPPSFLLAAAFCLAAGWPARAGDLKIIANPSVPAAAVSADELKAVVLLQKASLSDGSHVEPVLEKGGPTYAAFLKEYLGKTEAAWETYYRGLVFTGKGSMPKSVGWDAEMIAFLAKPREPSATCPAARMPRESRPWK